jgi:protein-histidine pros-kinase
MIALYGDQNGFNWKLDDIVGAQLISVPMAIAQSHARSTLYTVMLAMAGVFVLMLVLLNLLLHAVVIRPVVKIARIADAVSLGDMSVPEYVKPGWDEISSLSTSVTRLRRSLVSAMKLLEGGGSGT